MPMDPEGFHHLLLYVFVAFIVFVEFVVGVVFFAFVVLVAFVGFAVPDPVQ
jgi:hypothetical protein